MNQYRTTIHSVNHSKFIVNFTGYFFIFIGAKYI